MIGIKSSKKHYLPDTSKNFYTYIYPKAEKQNLEIFLKTVLYI